ncbi:MAG: acetyl ornithine aminotransferase family protein [Nitrososphaerota archaeon]|nr:acetyl ornithine aminotransferase family protein [Candidatus Bathyarchaeota archaeon]MDW8023798.1 acetyl ornithine aminotransferase family protein [Nitrososphaerota archaeon]
MAVYPKIVVTPPGPRAREIVKESERLFSPSHMQPYPLVVESGRGCIIRDVDGNEYIDFNSGLGCLNVGHGHPRVVEAVKNQCDRFIHYPSAHFYYDQLVSLAKRLSEITPGKFEKKVFFSNSGSEAVEAAVKLAKWHTRKQLFIGFVNAFHGRTIGALSFTASKPIQRRYFSPLMPGVTHVPYPYCYRCPFNQKYPECHYWCVDFIDEFVLQRYVPPEDVAAIIFESIQGEGGCVVPPHGYFQRLKKLADKYGILLIDDETRTGMGRTGKWFAIEHWDVEPDILCDAEALASGLPLGATIAKARIMDWTAGSHATTLGGNPLSCTAAMAVIEVIKDERLLENATKQGTYILKRLEEFKDESNIVGDVRGKGLMIGVEIVEDKDGKKPAPEKAGEVVMRSWKRGVAVVTCGVSTISITPPLNITRDLVDPALDIIGDVIKKVDRGK